MSREVVFDGVVGEPPGRFRRWIAAHPYTWVVVVFGLIMVFGSPAIQHYSDVTEWALLVALAAGFSLLALAGALFTRHRVRQYDARTPE